MSELGDYAFNADEARYRTYKRNVDLWWKSFEKRIFELIRERCENGHLTLSLHYINLPSKALKEKEFREKLAEELRKYDYRVTGAEGFFSREDDIKISWE